MVYNCLVYFNIEMITVLSLTTDCKPQQQTVTLMFVRPEVLTAVTTKGTLPASGIQRPAVQ
jgi:hypothetical protein